MQQQGSIHTFFDLRAWQHCHQLVLWVYTTTKTFPPDERYSLTDQIRRAAVSVTSNIAEGFSRSGRAEKIQFYSIALGSITEIQNQLILARDVGYIQNAVYEVGYSLSVDAHKLVTSLMKGAISRYS